MAEHELCKLGVAGSMPVSSTKTERCDEACSGDE